MPNPFDCIQAKGVSARNTRELLLHAHNLRQARPDLDDHQVAEMLARTLGEKLSRKQRQTLDHATKITGIFVAHQRASGLEGKQAVLEQRLVMQTSRHVDQTVQSVEAAQIYHHRVMTSLLNKAILHTYRGWFGATKVRPEFSRNIGRALKGEAVDDPLAREVADQFRAVFDYTHTAYRRHNIDIGTIEGFIPQSHQAVPIATKGRDAWIDFIAPRLDRSKMISRDTGEVMTDVELREMLEDIHGRISHSDNVASDALFGINRGQRETLADRLERGRVLHFRDFDSWLEYDREFGNGGDLISSLYGYVQQQARNLGLLEALGPDPDAVVTAMARMAGDANAQLAIGSKAKHRGTRQSDRLMDQYHSLTGALGVAGNQLWAARFASVQNYLVSVGLGSTVIQAVFTDNNFQRMARMASGLSAVRQLPQFVAEYATLATGRGNTRAQALLRAGVTADYWLAGLHGQNRFLGELDGSRASHVFADFAMRFTQLSPVTHAGRAAFGVEFRHNLTLELRNAWDKVNPRFRQTLEHYGVTADQWAKLQKAVKDRPDAYTDRVGNTSVLDVFAIERTGLDRDLSRTLLRAIETELLSATPAASAATRALTTMGTRSGTPSGMAVRMMTQWWNWPISVWQGQILRRFYDPSFSRQTKLMQALDYAVSTTLMGMLAVQFTQMAMGRDPMPLQLDDGEVNWRWFMQGVTYGGGLGLLGDVLARDYRSGGFGGALAGAAGGPMLGRVGQGLYDLTLGQAQALAMDEHPRFGRRAVRALKSLTPLQSAWQLRLLMERMIFDRLQVWLDEDAYDTFRSRERNAARVGQEFFWRPGETAPDRGPRVERVTGL